MFPRCWENKAALARDPPPKCGPSGRGEVSRQGGGRAGARLQRRGWGALRERLPCPRGEWRQLGSAGTGPLRPVRVRQGASARPHDREVCSLIAEPPRGGRRPSHPRLQGPSSFCHREVWQLQWAPKVTVPEGSGHPVESFDDR